ncbi:DUF1806 family protein [Paenibacillus sp.]|uniref:DUF1806 family protein n=1 Tax=Paenibacillus sp. TaxID=58172 RepID=UPI002D468520|nr:DUF1806 family protein [Paenibacillus sp.]HZG85612.1 DUF1806 family protein [Paenibacillus sp.]
MQPIEIERLETVLQAYEGRTPYIHVEVTPGAFVRNVTAAIEQAYVRGSGPYRVALRLKGDGWIRAEGLTHMAEEPGRLLLAGHDELGRLTCGLQLSTERFEA